MKLRLSPSVLIALLSCCVGLAVARAATPAKQPNVLLFVTDDESWLERSAYGWSTLPTPHFDRVARQGVLFTRGFTSAPSCAPSRAALLTGRNFWELEQGAFIQAWLPAKFPVLPDLMEAGGYHAGFTGKGWGPGVTGPESGRARNPAGKVYNTLKRKQRLPAISDIDYAANFARFLDERKPGQPFWFWVGALEPHDPVDADNYRRLAAEHGLPLEQVKVPGFLPATRGVQRSRANILYEICHADADLGRILEILRERGELDNTLVIVTADNGTQVLRSKTNLYDWGLRVPLAMMWPARVKPGRRVDDFVNFIDFAPTVLEAAGLPVPKDMSGRSLLPVLFAAGSGQIDPARTWTAGGLEWHGESADRSLAGRMLRDERYLYIVNYSQAPRLAFSASRRLPDADYARTAEMGDEIDLVAAHPDHPEVRRFVDLLVRSRPREELYDVTQDPWQIVNLADSPAYQAIKAQLRSRLEAYQRQTRDPRITGEMAIFDETRAYVLKRKFGPGGYADK